MCFHVCVSVCVGVCVCECVYVYVCVCVCLSVCLSLYICLSVLVGLYDLSRVLSKRLVNIEFSASSSLLGGFLSQASWGSHRYRASLHYLIGKKEVGRK